MLEKLLTYAEYLHTESRGGPFHDITWRKSCLQRAALSEAAGNLIASEIAASHSFRLFISDTGLMAHCCSTGLESDLGLSCR